MTKKIKELENKIKNLKESNNCLKYENYRLENSNFWYMILCAILLIFMIVFMGLYLQTDYELSNMGQMVCEDNGHGDFIKFNSENKIIECEPKPTYQEYDGGYIKVRNENG